MKNLRLFVVIIFLFSVNGCATLDLFDTSQFTSIPPPGMFQGSPTFTQSITGFIGNVLFLAYMHKTGLLVVVLLLTTWLFYRRYRSTRRRRLNLNKDEECLLGLAFDALRDLYRYRQARRTSNVLPLTRNP